MQIRILAKTDAFIKARVTKGYSQRELARHSGLSNAYISLLERSIKSVGPSTAKRLSDLLEKELEEIFTSILRRAWQMDIKKVIVTGRMYKDLEKIALLDTKREYLFLPEEQVSANHFDWADGYVAFKPTTSFHFGKLQWVHALGAGVDAFLRNREWKKDVVLTRTVGSFGRKIGEYCLSYLLADTQRHAIFQQNQRDRQWLPSQMKLLHELNIVIFGTGTIGEEVARMLRTFGVTVHGVSRSGAANSHFDSVLPITKVHAVLAQADWVINTLPLTPMTDGLFGMGLFSHMHGASFINVGRGASVDDNALLEAIESGHVRKAVLDVFREEPLLAQSPLWAHPNVVVTPHISAITGLDEAIDELLAVLGEMDSGQKTK